MLIKSMFEDEEDVVSFLLCGQESVVVLHLHVDDEFEALGIGALGNSINITTCNSSLNFMLI